jgi:hypothetical protein
MISALEVSALSKVWSILDANGISKMKIEINLYLQSGAAIFQKLHLPFS